MGEAALKIIDGVEVLIPTTHPAEGRTPANAHSEETKEEVFRRILAGEKLYKIARDMDIGIRTMGPWIKELEDQIGLIVKAENMSLIEDMGLAAKQFVYRLSKNKNITDSNNENSQEGGRSQTEISPKDAKDLAVALGILIDKRKELTGSSSGHGGMSLKVAWKDGTGALELRQE